MPIEVKCAGKGNKLLGRNGVFDIDTVVISDSKVDGHFHVGGVSSRLHRNLAGCGFVLDGVTLDHLAIEWLRSRGQKNPSPMPPEAERVLRKIQELKDLLAMM